MIGGTSTGGIIGLAIANKVPMEAVEALYYETAAKVFAKQSTLRQLFTGSQARAEPLLPLLS